MPQDIPDPSAVSRRLVGEVPADTPSEEDPVDNTGPAVGRIVVGGGTGRHNFAVGIEGHPAGNRLGSTLLDLEKF